MIKYTAVSENYHKGDSNKRLVYSQNSASSAYNQMSLTKIKAIKFLLIRVNDHLATAIRFDVTTEEFKDTREIYAANKTFAIIRWSRM